MPILSLFVKITPTGVEGAVYACLTGIFNFQNNIISPFMGVWINKQIFDVSATNMYNYKLMMLASCLLGPLSLFLLPLIPNES